MKHSDYRNALIERRRTPPADRRVADDSGRSERHRAGGDAALQRYVSLLDACPDGIVVITDGYFSFASEPAAAMLGYAHPDRMLGLKAADRIAPEYRDFAIANRIAVMESRGGSARTVATVLKADGSPLDVEFWISKVDWNGVPSALVTIRDRTEMAETKKALQETEALFRNIADNIPGMVYQRAIDANGALRFTYVNEQATEIVGFAAAAIVATPALIVDRIHSEDREPHVRGVRQSFVDLRQHAGDFRYMHPTRGQRWLHTISRPRRRADGSVVTEGITFDITDRKTTEQELEANRQSLNAHIIELQDTRDRLEQRTGELVRTIGDLAKMRDAAEAANRTKSEFLATMSHEIRTPMNGVLGMANLLLQMNLRDDQREFVEVINQSGQALLDIINDVLDFSKMEAGHLSLEETEFSVVDTVDSVIQLMSPRCTERALTLRSFVARDIPDTVVGDPGRLRQILVNLLGNAVKFTETGSVSLEVSAARAVGRDLELKFAVIDTGIGIPDGARERLFQVFSQADASTTRKYGGTGLGLSICKRLCVLMGGAIAVDSSPGAGSTFRFTAKFRHAGPDAPSESPETGRRRPRAVLMTRAGLPDCGLARQLEENGVEVLAAATAEDVIRLVLNSDADRPAVFVDDETAELARNAVAEIETAIGAKLHRIWATKRKAAHAPGGDAAVPSTGMQHAEADDLSPDISILDMPLRQKQLRHATRALFAGDDGVGPLPPADGASGNSPAPSPIARPENQVSVLLVEDNAINQRVACAMLEKAGINVVVASNGAEALATLEKQDFDMVLMDIHMPVMDGLAAARRIRRMPEPKCRTPIIALTANAMTGDREKYLDAGMDDYVSKPIDSAMLSAAIARHAGQPVEVSAALPQPLPGGNAPPVSPAELDRVLNSMDDLPP